MNVPKELKYAKTHEWVKMEDGTAVVGLSDYAQNELGDLVFVNLPEAGDQVDAGEPFGDVESVKAVSDLNSPVTGTVTEINEELLDTPEPVSYTHLDVYKRQGLTLTSYRFRGLVKFIEEGWGMEYMCLYTADGYEGEMISCNEGTLEWVKKSEIENLNLWEGDKIFFRLIRDDAPFFSLKLRYQANELVEAVLDGKALKTGTVETGHETSIHHDEPEPGGES